MGVRKKEKETNTSENTKEGADTMNANVGYAPSDLNSISKKPSKIVSSKSALKDVTPFPWSDEVISGKKKVTFITKDNKK